MKKITTAHILFFCGLLLFIYTALRAYLLSFTYDESWTYTCFVHTGFTTFKTFHPGDTNNHLLNTWLMELFIRLFGESEFVLRLPNVLSHLIFLVFSAKLALKLSSRWLTVCAFLLVNANPFLLDFFSLARGYGISFAMLMASIWFACRYICADRKLISAFLSVLFAAIGVLAYFSMLNYLLIDSGILSLVCTVRIIREVDKKNAAALLQPVVILLPLIVLFYIIPILLGLKNAGALEIGGMQGFWKDTVLTLIQGTLYELHKATILERIIEQFVIVALATALGLFYGLASKKFSSNNLFFVFLFAVTTLLFAANYFQFTYLQIPYPMGRYALSYFILFMLLLAFLAEQMEKRFQKIVKPFLFTVTSFFMVSFGMNANINHTHDWFREINNREVFSFLEKNKKKIPAGKNVLTIGATFQQGADAVFYKIFNRFRWLQVAEQNFTVHPLTDYYYIHDTELTHLPDVKYKIMKVYPESKTLLIENIQRWKEEIIYSGKIKLNRSPNKIKTDSLNPYSAGFTYIAEDSLLSNTNGFALLNCMALTKTKGARGQFIISYDINGQLDYYNINLRDVIEKANVWTHVSFLAFIPPDIEKGTVIKSYFWNFGTDEVLVDDLNFKIVCASKVP